MRGTKLWTNTKSKKIKIVYNNACEQLQNFNIFQNENFDNKKLQIHLNTLIKTVSKNSPLNSKQFRMISNSKLIPIFLLVYHLFFKYCPLLANVDTIKELPDIFVLNMTFLLQPEREFQNKNEKYH